MNEFEQKQERIRVLLARQGLDALVLRRVSSFAWATCGATSYINTASSEGTATLVITPNSRYLITDNIEQVHYADEEKLGAQGWEFQIAPWYETHRAVEQLTRGLKVGSDVAGAGVTDVSVEIGQLRAALTPEEGERFRALGRLCVEAMEAAILAVRPGMTEYGLSALMAVETERRGAQAVVLLVATDERIFNVRHPLPTDKRLERYAMLILCGRKWGLICSLTRLVYFGRLPEELRRKAEACARVDTRIITATRPGTTLGQIFQTAVDAYRDNGFADEWLKHHQGGLAGYEPRETFGVPGSPVVVAEGQAYAWNPSITGVKSEDTILVGTDGNEIITPTPGLPTVAVEVNGRTLLRPAILER